MKTREELIEETASYKIAGVMYDNLYFSWEDVQKILTTPTKEQMECKFCHSSNPIHITDEDYLEVNTSLLLLNKKRSFDIEPWKLGKARVKFCPMCGRNLKEG